MQVFTIVEGDYARGAAALINSLARASDGQFRIHVGYVGDIDMVVERGAPVSLHKLSPSSMWVGNRKLEFIFQIATQEFIFLDADCLVCSRDFLELSSSTVREAPIFCVEGLVPKTDIRRKYWTTQAGRVLEALSSGVRTDLYFNSGFFGGHVRRDAHIFEKWQTLMSSFLSDNGGRMYTVPGFPMPDQDCLNAVLQSEQPGFASIGPPDVWYANPKHHPFLHIGVNRTPLLLHQTGENKPWRLKKVPPRAPSIYEQAWFRFIAHDTPWCSARCGFSLALRSWFNQAFYGRVLSRIARYSIPVAGLTK